MMKVTRKDWMPVSDVAIGSTSPGYGAYAASKGATDVLTRALALELRDRDITVNAISPEVGGPCPAGRIAEIVVHLLSAPGRRLNGQIIRLDGRLRGTA